MPYANAVLKELFRAKLNAWSSTPLTPPPLPPTRGRSNSPRSLAWIPGPST